MVNHVTRQPDYTPEELVYLTIYNLSITYFLYIGLAAMIFLFAVYNGTSRLLSSYYVRRYHSLHPISTRGMGTGRMSMRCLPSATLAVWRKATYRRGQLVDLLGMGSSGQLTVVVVYYALNMGLAFSGALGHPDYQAHHCARLCFANVPIIIGLASKELGVIGWVTGLSPATLISFHRWAARLVFFLACYHVFGRAYTNVPLLDPSVHGQRYQAWGIAGMIFWGLMVFSSGKPIRDRWYSAFIFLHIGAFCFSVICLSFHRPHIAAYLVAGCVIYVADRLVRFGSTCYWNMFKQTGRGQGPTAMVEVVAHDAIRITFRSAMRWFPGAHVYLHAPLLGAGGHPFSIASTFLPVTHLEDDPFPQSANQIFIVRVHSGITRALYDAAMKGEDADDHPMQSSSRYPSTPLWPAWVEGPYGHKPLAHHYESVLLITGGSGVSFSIPILLDLVRRARNKHLGGTKALITTKVTWVWTVREKEQIDWVADSLRDAIHYAPPGFLDVAVYVTGPSKGFSESNLNAAGIGPRTETYDTDFSGEYPIPTTTTSSSNSFRNGPVTFPPPASSANSYQAVENAEPFSLDHNSETTLNQPASAASLTPGGTRPLTPLVPSGPHQAVIPTFYSRCRVRDTLAQVIQDTIHAGSVSVGTCGPPTLANEVGNACSDAIQPGKVWRGEHRVNMALHRETFGW